MDLTTLIHSIILVIVSGVISFIGWIVKQMSDKINNAVTESQVDRLINNKIELVNEKQKSISDDVNRLENKIDYIIKLMIDK